ncbi:MAG: hypothetical protein IT479_01120 [Xanthomonadales bacterium]|nr:hypothetical protein [Xanthomonadales bacterium]MCC6591849.1 hypothetical protein [Xanthomonadales bacterium]
MPGRVGSNTLVRWVLLALSATTLAIALYAFTLPVIDVPRANSQLPMLKAWWHLVRLHRLQPIEHWMQVFR